MIPNRLPAWVDKAPPYWDGTILTTHINFKFNLQILELDGKLFSARAQCNDRSGLFGFSETYR
jgi:hypothetical protein